MSARLIEQAGFKSFNVGGSALLAARHALPDLGLAAFGEMLAGIRDIVDASRLPCLVDADDGYGDVKSVIRTIGLRGDRRVRRFARGPVARGQAAGRGVRAAMSCR